MSRAGTFRRTRKSIRGTALKLHPYNQNNAWQPFAQWAACSVFLGDVAGDDLFERNAGATGPGWFANRALRRGLGVISGKGASV